MQVKLEISDFELNQSGVIKILAYLEERLVGNRIANDHPDSDPLLRGNIAELKLLLKKIKPTDKFIAGVNNPKLRT